MGNIATTAILGAGNMGEAVLAGILSGGRPAEKVLVGEKRAERAAELTERYGVRVVDNTEAAATAETLVLVVKPGDVAAVLAEISPFLTERHLIVSLAAGITTEFIEDRVPERVPVVRVMPNTPAMIGEGMSAASAGSSCTEAHLAEVVELLSATGRVITIEERYQDAVTAVSGSGPAYLFYVAEAMIEAGVHLGLPRPVATELAVQTLLGSATMLRDSGTHPSILREQVTSPAGTTAAALRELDEYKVRAAFNAAMEACRDRSEELAEDL
jgi:pyrroline-5-carboxylate reductase